MMKRVVTMCIHLAVFSVTKAKSIDLSADVIADSRSHKSNARRLLLARDVIADSNALRQAFAASSLTRSSHVALEDHNGLDEDNVGVAGAPVLDYETAFETDRPVVATPPYRVLFATSSMEFDTDGWSDGVQVPTSYDCPPRIDRYASTRALKSRHDQQECNPCSRSRSALLTHLHSLPPPAQQKLGRGSGGETAGNVNGRL